MILLGQLCKGLGAALHVVLILFLWVFIIRAVISWFEPNPHNALVQYLISVTEPILARVRRRVPPLGIVDLSVIIVIALIYFVDAFVAGSLYRYGEYFSMQAVSTVGF